MIDAPDPVAPEEAAGTAEGPANAAPARFPVETSVFTGELEELVRASHRGDVDLTGISVSEITSAYRKQVEAAVRAGGEPDLREVADFISLASRLVAEKAKVALPDDTPEIENFEVDPSTEAGRRLAEYRLFRAAADALLSGAAEDGARNFLGLVVPEVVPVERLRIAPEKLAAAFRAVLERFPDDEPIAVGIATFTVAEVADRLRARLREMRTLDFNDVFEGVTSRMEAVAFFLALLELLRGNEVVVEQPSAMEQITVTLCG